MPPVTGVAHLGLSVRNLPVSETWYCELFGLERVYSDRHANYDLVVLQDPDSELVISLRRHHGAATARFDETRTGLDHVSFGVPDRSALDAWAERLTERRIEHSPMAETDFGWVLVFRDPDHIQLELFCRRQPALRVASDDRGNDELDEGVDEGVASMVAAKTVPPVAAATTPAKVQPQIASSSPEPLAAS